MNNSTSFKTFFDFGGEKKLKRQKYQKLVSLIELQNNVISRLLIVALNSRPYVLEVQHTSVHSSNSSKIPKPCRECEARQSETWCVNLVMSGEKHFSQTISLEYT